MCLKGLEPLDKATLNAERISVIQIFMFYYCFCVCIYIYIYIYIYILDMCQQHRGASLSVRML